MINSGIKHVCFDLDGTLINSYETIYKATLKALEELKINSKIEEKEFHKRIGWHFVDIFEDLNIPVADFELFIGIYKDHYFDFINESEIYPGVLELLKKLKNENIKVSLLTTKGQGQADKIIDHFELREYFDLVMGRRNGVAHKPSPEPLQLICSELNIKTTDSMMVGDTELDIKCGKNASSKTCAVTYGYRTKEMLLKENPDFIVDSLNEIFD